MRKCAYLLALCLTALSATLFIACNDDDGVSDAESNAYVIYSFDVTQSEYLNFDVKTWLKDYLKERGITDALGTIKLTDITNSSTKELYIMTTTDKKEAVDAVLNQLQNDTTTLDSIVISKGSAQLFTVEGACSIGTTHSFTKVFSYTFKWPVQQSNVVSDVVGTYATTTQPGCTITLTSETVDGQNSVFKAEMTLSDGTTVVPAHYFRAGPRVTLTSDDAAKTYNGTLVMTSRDCSSARFLLKQLNEGTSTVLINDAPFVRKQ